jgi:hypothetical protein
MTDTTKTSKAARLAPPVPFEVALWGIDDVAGYLRRAPAVTRDRIVVLPSFPPAIRLPGNARPLWQAKEVYAWALSYKETERAGRPRKTA